MDTIRSLVQPLVGPSTASSAGMIDGMKLVVLGGTVATARKMGSRAWLVWLTPFFLTAHFSEDDYPYDWLMLWLSRRPEWQRSREFETTTRLATPLSGGSNSSSSRTADNSFGDEDYRECYDGDDVPGKVKTRVVFQPTFDTTHTIYYRGHWLRVRRWRKGDNMGSKPKSLCFYSIDVVARSNTILKQLVLQAKREYEAEAIHRIQIYFADSHGGWRLWTDSRHKRPMSSIVLNPGYKEMLLSDTKDFLNSEKWYADRGIPFRRGYLLHGVPGSGKSSLIHAIAGELMLDIYALSLSAAWINDATLTTLMGRVPARCIVLLEDLDAAFTRSTGRRSKKDKKRKDKKDKKDKKRRTGTSGINGGANTTDALSEVNTLSLSGLLNALDGVAAAEGRLLFATTNHLDHLDPALSRPGRMDVWIDFKNASKWQAEALFRNFFPSCEEDSSSGDQEKKASRASTPTPASPSSSLPSLRSSFSS
ncbi:P-loop containing nucleoside triphosphate hydrolase protein, partial [Lentinula edodes]